jgi:N-acyl homoserine lactone hydrolase
LTKDCAVRLVPTPGHTNGHLSVAVETGDSLVLIAGDAAYSEHALLAGVVDGVAQSTAAHRDSTHRLRELCRRRRVVTQFAHDPRSAERLAGDVPTAVSDEP